MKLLQIRFSNWSRISMSIENHQITVSGLRVAIVRKDIKNLHLGVYPPSGRVRGAAPLRVSNEAVRLAVIGKLRWIKRQRARFEDQPRQSARDFVDGESHFYLGRRYRLKVIEQSGPGHVALRGNGGLELHVRSGATLEQRERVFQQCYRERLRVLTLPLVERWQSHLGVNLTAWGIKKMKTKWGSCNSEARRIWINLEMAKKPAKCLEYIVVHELVHLLGRRHNERFMDLMDGFLPKWRLYRAELNRAPLSHESWSYW